MQNINNTNIVLPTNLVRNEHSWHLFVIRALDRDELQKYLKNHNVQTLIHYPIPPHKQKAYQNLKSLKLPLTERIHKEALSIPLYETLKDASVEYIVNVINDYS
jgi:dTDP-4-amino-4,6-dideoxygalactose transaminase